MPGRQVSRFERAFLAPAPQFRPAPAAEGDAPDRDAISMPAAFETRERPQASSGKVISNVVPGSG
jgi:hypothetical protein